MGDKAFLVDTTKCSGCRSCQVACKQWNNLPGEKTEFFAGPEYTNPKQLSAITWNHVVFFNIVRRSNTEKQWVPPSWTIMHKKCYHCNVANCMRVCPEKAISKVDGWTVIDQAKCIGCGACVNECIYKVPHVNPKDNKTYKCHACMTNQREVPACAFACPTGALTFGHRLEILKIAEARLKSIKATRVDSDGVKEPPLFPDACIYGKDQYEGLHVITILKDKPEKYGLEVNPKPVEITKVDTVNGMYSLLSLFTFGLPSLKRKAYSLSRSFTERKDS
jgi:formate dehydrogenase iron-sulfur subunit